MPTRQPNVTGSPRWWQSGQRINRNDVLRDASMQPILASIDASVRAILPEFCS